MHLNTATTTARLANTYQAFHFLWAKAWAKSFKCVLSVTFHNNSRRWLDLFSFAMKRSSLTAARSLPKRAHLRHGTTQTTGASTRASRKSNGTWSMRRAQALVQSAKHAHGTLPSHLHSALLTLPVRKGLGDPRCQGVRRVAKPLPGKPFSLCGRRDGGEAGADSPEKSCFPFRAEHSWNSEKRQRRSKTHEKRSSPVLLVLVSVSDN